MTGSGGVVDVHRPGAVRSDDEDAVGSDLSGVTDPVEGTEPSAVGGLNGVVPGTGETQGKPSGQLLCLLESGDQVVENRRTLARGGIRCALDDLEMQQRGRVLVSTPPRAGCGWRRAVGRPRTRGGPRLVRRPEVSDGVERRSSADPDASSLWIARAIHRGFVLARAPWLGVGIHRFCRGRYYRWGHGPDDVPALQF